MSDAIQVYDTEIDPENMATILECVSAARLRKDVKIDPNAMFAELLAMEDVSIETLEIVVKQYVDKLDLQKFVMQSVAAAAIESDQSIKHDWHDLARVRKEEGIDSKDAGVLIGRGVVVVGSETFVGGETFGCGGETFGCGFCGVKLEGAI